jgi:hypothetical protein
MMHRAVQHGLNDMRAAGYPGGLPPLLHLIRSVAGNFLDSSPDMRPSASSLMLVHAMPASADDVAPTTRKFYLSNQRMDAKTAAIAAIAAWAGAVMDAYAKAGGQPSAPRERTKT